MVAGTASASSARRSAGHRWLPGTTSVAPFSVVKSSSAHMVLITSSWCGRATG